MYTVVSYKDLIIDYITSRSAQLVSTESAAAPSPFSACCSLGHPSPSMHREEQRLNAYDGSMC